MPCVFLSFNMNKSELKRIKTNLFSVLSVFPVVKEINSFELITIHFNCCLKKKRCGFSHTVQTYHFCCYKDNYSFVAEMMMSPS